MSAQAGPLSAPAETTPIASTAPAMAAPTAKNFFALPIVSPLFLALDKDAVGSREGPRRRAGPAAYGDRDDAVMDVPAGEPRHDLHSIELRDPDAVLDRPGDVPEVVVRGDVLVGDARDPDARGDDLRNVPAGHPHVRGDRVAARPGRHGIRIDVNDRRIRGRGRARLRIVRVRNPVVVLVA